MADVSVLNPNVLYEIGYAIALGKPVSIFIDSSLGDQDNLRSRIGFFDIIGYNKYQDASNLKDLILAINRSKNPFPLIFDLDYRAPVFLLDAYQKDGLTSSLYSWVNKLIVHFRSFDPVEKARLPFHQVIREIASSIGAGLREEWGSKPSSYN